MTFTTSNAHKYSRNTIIMSDIREKIQYVIDDFELNDEKLLEISEILKKEFNKGLAEEDSVVKMLPSYVRDVPDGTEEGLFLALNLGGSKFRVLLVELAGRKLSSKTKEYELRKVDMHGTGEKLFDNIAECLADFINQQRERFSNLGGNALPLGFTFSYPCKQSKLDEAILIRWTKDFTCPGVEGEDVVKLLREAIQRKGDLQIDIVAVINDTTGALVSCAHKNSNCWIGVVVGTGTNACYMERLENIPKWTGDRDDPKQVIINCEWGAFGDNGCIDAFRNDFDRELDAESINPGQQLFEKMISGMYMGELVRRVAIRLSKDGLFGSDSVPELFNTQGRFKSKYVSYAEGDLKNKNNSKTLYVLHKLGYNNVSEQDISVIQLVCQTVSTRAAHLVAAGITTILNKIERDFTNIGMEGSVYFYHPFFGDRIKEKIKELCDHKFELILSEDGSGRGAALVAALATKLNQQKAQEKDKTKTGKTKKNKKEN